MVESEAHFLLQKEWASMMDVGVVAVTLVVELYYNHKLGRGLCWIAKKALLDPKVIFAVTI